MTFTPKPGRIPCCVPFCRRTAKDDGTEGHEIICGRHWRLADRTLTRRYKRLQKAVYRLMETPPEALTDAERERVLRHFEFSRRTWHRIKQQAIERAAGIG